MQEFQELLEYNIVSNDFFNKYYVFDDKYENYKFIMFRYSYLSNKLN